MFHNNYYTIHSSCKGKLYKYLILNNTNFYSSLPGEKSGFVMVVVRVRILDIIPLLSNLS